MLGKFGQKQVSLIEDITDFVREQKQHVDNRQLERLTVPQERIYTLLDSALAQKIGVRSLAF